MIEPDSLRELPMLKHHCTPGDVRRDDLAAYVDLGEYHEAEQEQEQEQPDEQEREVAVDGW